MSTSIEVTYTITFTRTFSPAELAEVTGRRINEIEQLIEEGELDAEWLHANLDPSTELETEEIVSNDYDCFVTQ